MVKVNQGHNFQDFTILILSNETYTQCDGTDCTSTHQKIGETNDTVVTEACRLRKNLETNRLIFRKLQQLRLKT